jgi:hypothetical protein
MGQYHQSQSVNTDWQSEEPIMGKKSRLKHEKRKNQTDIPAAAVQPPQPKQPSRDKRFCEQLAELRDYLVQFSAYDVILALGVSDLWRPNRSSQVKHSLAMLIALSIPLRKYQGLWWSSYFGQFNKFGSCRLMLESNG